jgi:hypothetical protein
VSHCRSEQVNKKPCEVTTLSQTASIDPHSLAVVLPRRCPIVSQFTVLTRKHLLDFTISMQV